MSTVLGFMKMGGLLPCRTGSKTWLVPTVLGLGLRLRLDPKVLTLRKLSIEGLITRI